MVLSLLGSVKKIIKKGGEKMLLTMSIQEFKTKLNPMWKETPKKIREMVKGDNRYIVKVDTDTMLAEFGYPEDEWELG